MTNLAYKKEFVMKIKTNMIIGLSLALTFPMASYAVASKIVITGQPVIVQKNGDVYTLPNDYKATGTYNYVTLDGTQTVCYTTPPDELTTITPAPKATKISVNVSGSNVEWSCYQFDNTYFEVKP